MSRCISAALVALSLVCANSCKAPSPLYWYKTCGDPVCMDNGYRPKPGIPLCMSAQASQQVCSTFGDMCDPVDSCNSLLLCTDTDPTQNQGGCPISTRQTKADIQYLTSAENAAYLEHVSQMKLARYRYNWERKDERPHLGFIIDDAKGLGLQAVTKSGMSIDVYGYTSMAIAAIQAQNSEIEQLKQEIKALKMLIKENERGQFKPNADIEQRNESNDRR